MSVGQEKGRREFGCPPLEGSKEILTRAILLQAAQLALSANRRGANGAVAFRRFCHVGRLEGPARLKTSVGKYSAKNPIARIRSALALSAGRRQGSVDHFQLVGTAEAPDLNNPVARLPHGKCPRNSQSGGKKTVRGCFADRPGARWTN